MLPLLCGVFKSTVRQQENTTQKQQNGPLLLQKRKKSLFMFPLITLMLLGSQSVGQACQGLVVLDKKKIYSAQPLCSKIVLPLNWF